MSDGRVFTGSQALGLKLIDEVGNKKQAIAWLEREKGVPKDLPVRDWKPSGDNNLRPLQRGGRSRRRGRACRTSRRCCGRWQMSASSPVLDGLLAVWHP